VEEDENVKSFLKTKLFPNIVVVGPKYLLILLKYMFMLRDVSCKHVTVKKTNKKTLVYRENDQLNFFL